MTTAVKQKTYLTVDATGKLFPEQNAPEQNASWPKGPSQHVSRDQIQQVMPGQNLPGQILPWQTMPEYDLTSPTPTPACTAAPTPSQSGADSPLAASPGGGATSAAASSPRASPSSASAAGASLSPANRSGAPEARLDALIEMEGEDEDEVCAEDAPLDSALDQTREDDYNPPVGRLAKIGKIFGFFLFWGTNGFLIFYLVPKVVMMMMGKG